MFLVCCQGFYPIIVLTCPCPQDDLSMDSELSASTDNLTEKSSKVRDDAPLCLHVSSILHWELLMMSLCNMTN